ncbi:MAG: methyltransferase domain-containing protein [Pseudomonadota bacterium]
MDLKEEAALGGAVDDHWYYVSKAQMMAEKVKTCRQVLDVGAGSGFFSRWMLKHGMADSAVCVDPGYEIEHDRHENGKTVSFRKQIDRSSADLVLMMDVLEHVDDDVGFLADYVTRVEPGTRIFITVPAFEFIWSAHDDFLEHRRRYTLDQLRGVIDAAGAQEVAGHYYFGLIFPIAAAVRLLQRGRPAESSDMAVQPAVTNAALKAACAVERTIMGWNRVAGLSVVMLCEVPERH